MQGKRKMSGGKSAHSFYPAPGIYHLHLLAFIILRIKAFLYKKAPIHIQNYVQEPVLSKSCLIIQRIEDNRTCLSGFLQSMIL